MYDRFLGIKFWSSDRNTENTVSQLYVNEDSYYSEEKTWKWNISLHHRKKLNILTPQLPIYYI